MRGEGLSDARRRRVTAQLGTAVYAALRLMVREYLDAGGIGNFDAPDDLGDLDALDALGTESVGAEVNDSFDMARYLALGGGATAQEPVRETESVSRAGEAEASFARQSLAAVRRVRGTAEDGDAISRSVRRGGETAWQAVRAEDAAERRRGMLETAESRVDSVDAFYTAARVSEEIERDARRYDGGLE